MDRLLFHLLKVLRLKYFSFKFPHIIDFRPSLLMFTEPVCEELDFSFYNFMLTRSYAKKICQQKNLVLHWLNKIEFGNPIFWKCRSIFAWSYLERKIV